MSTDPANQTSVHLTTFVLCTEHAPNIAIYLDLHTLALTTRVNQQAHSLYTRPLTQRINNDTVPTRLFTVYFPPRQLFPRYPNRRNLLITSEFLCPNRRNLLITSEFLYPNRRNILISSEFLRNNTHQPNPRGILTDIQLELRRGRGAGSAVPAALPRGAGDT